MPGELPFGTHPQGQLEGLDFVVVVDAGMVEDDLSADLGFFHPAENDGRLALQIGDLDDHRFLRRLGLAEGGQWQRQPADTDRAPGIVRLRVHEPDLQLFESDEARRPQTDGVLEAVRLACEERGPAVGADRQRQHGDVGIVAVQIVPVGPFGSEPGVGGQVLVDRQHPVIDGSAGNPAQVDAVGLEAPRLLEGIMEHHLAADLEGDLLDLEAERARLLRFGKAGRRAGGLGHASQASVDRDEREGTRGQEFRDRLHGDAPHGPKGNIPRHAGRRSARRHSD
jgi:hypothetical protein